MVTEKNRLLGQPLEIAQVQEIVLGVLCELDGFCKRAGIDYFLVGGALIGAVRSGDLIPWDDDIDVAMKRDDYERFCEEYVDNERFSLLTYKRTAGYRRGIAKLIDNDTVFVEPTARGDDVGVFVDVFPFDYIPEKSGPKIGLLNTRVRVYNYAHAITSAYTRGNYLKTAIRVALSKTVGRRGHVRALGNLESMMRSDDSPYLTNYWGAKERVPADWFSKAVDVQLRGRSFPAPIGYAEYLTQVYGDYMNPPTNPPHYHGQAFKKVAGSADG